MLIFLGCIVGFCLAAIVDLVICQYVAPLRRVGGLTFWRIGRIGGSFYIRR
jgi:hypothetical protein